MTTRLLPPHGGLPRDVSLAVNQAIKGKINSVGTVTLTHDAASTTVDNAFVGSDSAVFLFPQTANAGAELAAGGLYIDPANYVSKESFAITHANNSQTDRTFSYVILG